MTYLEVNVIAFGGTEICKSKEICQKFIYFHLKVMTYLEVNVIAFGGTEICKSKEKLLKVFFLSESYYKL